MSLERFRVWILAPVFAFSPAMLVACDDNTGNEDEAADEHADEEAADDHATEMGEGEEEAGDCAAEDRDDDFTIGLNKSGAALQATFVSADPAPPIKGDNTWVLDFSDLGGQPLTGLTMTVIPTMPDHGHGTPVNVLVTETEVAGRYELTPVNLFMTGFWEVNIEVELEGGEQDSLMFGFCVE